MSGRTLSRCDCFGTGCGLLLGSLGTYSLDELDGDEFYAILLFGEYLFSAKAVELYLSCGKIH